MSVPPSILLVEDEGAVSLILGKEFEANGYKVLKARNGREGLDTALKEHPDVILTDIKMPVMSGMEMIQELRNDAWGKDVKIIVLTNISDMDTLQGVVEQGTFYYIVKGDLKMEEIVGRVKELLTKPTNNPLR